MNELKIENNRVICDCGKDLGEFEEGKVFFCEKCLKAGFSRETYGIRVSIEDVFGNNIKRKRVN